MRRRTLGGSGLLFVTLATAACAAGVARTPVAAPGPVPRTAPAAAPVDASAALLGHWTWTADVGGEGYAGTLDLSRGQDGWHGKVVENSMGELAVTSIAVEGTTVTLGVLAGENPSTVKATLQPDGTLSGPVLTGGREGTFSAKKA